MTEAQAASAAMDIAEIALRAKRFRARLDAVKASLHADFEWYPYHMLGNFEVLPELLTGSNRRLLELAGGRPILDIGASDGDNAFFFESLGFTVHAIDHPVTGQNGMEGIRALKRALDSSVEIHALDLNEPFTLPATGYGLALMLGVLYHMKNPFYALEHLAKHARYCLLSTRIARRTPDGRSIEGSPVAYLLGADELNDDWTNYWIFSEAALRRLFERTNWIVRDYATFGDRRRSDPVRRDERAFCLLESRFGRHELLEGWHLAEGEGFRWTEQRFAIAAPRSKELELRLYVPDFLLARFGSLTLSGCAEGVELPPATFTTCGEHVYKRRLPDAERLRIDFRLDHALPADDTDRRERGIIVTAVAIL